MWFQETWRLLVGRHDGRTAGTHGEMMMTRFDGPARAIRCAVALCDAAQGIRVASAQGVHVGEIESRGPPTGLTALGIDAVRRPGRPRQHPGRQRGEGRLPVRNHNMADGRVVFQGIE